MRVGILSMQRIKNYGSFLQAYGLKMIVEKLGGEVKFIDYHPGNPLISTDDGKGLKRTILKGLDTFRGNAPLLQKLKYIKYKKNYASNYYPYLGISDKKKYSTDDIDVLIIGSDEVFNCVQSNVNVGFSPDLFGQNSNAKKTISYAASFGNTNYEKLKKYDVASKVAGWLNTFDAISVRDHNSAVTVKKLINVEPEINLDPVLMYDFIGNNKIPTNIDEKDKYLLLYGYSYRFTSEECKLIRNYAVDNNLKIFCIGGIQSCCDKFIDCDPFKIIAYFQHAECVITDTFHGTIMSIITHKQFVSIVRNAGYGNSEKLTDLLVRLKLSNRQLTDFKLINNKLSTKVDYQSTDQIIKEERKKTINYLRRQLNA